MLRVGVGLRLGGEGGGGVAIPGAINSRQDAINALDRIIGHFDAHEPTSPVPHMLRRVKRVALMDFMELVQEFQLTGNPPIEAVFGPQEEDSA